MRLKRIAARLDGLERRLRRQPRRGDGPDLIIDVVPCRELVWEDGKIVDVREGRPEDIELEEFAETDSSGTGAGLRISCRVADRRLWPDG